MAKPNKPAAVKATASNKRPAYAIIRARSIPSASTTVDQCTKSIPGDSVQFTVREQRDADGNLPEIEISVKIKAVGASVTAKQLGRALKRVPEELQSCFLSLVQGTRGKSTTYTAEDKAYWVQEVLKEEQECGCREDAYAIVAAKSGNRPGRSSLQRWCPPLK